MVNQTNYYPKSLAEKPTYPPDVFTSMAELRRMSRFARLFQFSSRPKKINSILGGRHASRLRGRGLDFEEVRNYVKGDDIRHIDWKVTARTRETHTRVFTEEKERPVLIIVDQSKSMFFGSQRRMKSVVAAELAALAAFKILKSGDRVGGVVFADQGIDYILPKRDRKNILRFLERIVTRNRELRDSNPVEFEEALEKVIKRINNIVTHNFLVVIISDFRRYSPKTIKSISMIAQHNDVILAKVMDPMERDIPDTRFIAGDGEKQITVEGKSAALRAQFKIGFEQDIISFETEMRKHRIPVLTLDTIDPVDQQLKDIFGRI